MNPTQVTNLQTNLKAVHRFYKFRTVWDIIVAMSGSPEAAQLLNIIIGKLSENAGSDESITLTEDHGAKLGLLKHLAQCGVHVTYNASLECSYCWIETDLFITRLAQVLSTKVRQTGPGAARLLLQLPWNMKYHDYIMSPQWAAKRLARFVKDCFTCQRCGAQSKPGARIELEAHHTSDEAYASLGKENIDQHLVTLCIVCHAQVHAEENGGKWYRKPRKAAVKWAVGE